MISDDILRGLVPNRLPEQRDDWDDRWVDLPDFDPSRFISAWASHLRQIIAATIAGPGPLGIALRRSDGLAVGVFPTRESADGGGPFPVIGGYRFAVAVLHPLDRGGDPVDRPPPLIQVPEARGAVPLLDLRTALRPQAAPDGEVAAQFADGGTLFGLTADHVVQGKSIGGRVDVRCRDCGQDLLLDAPSPGVTDAATLRYPCTCALTPGGDLMETHPVRRPREGQQVIVHLVNSGKVDATVTCSVQTNAQAICAATPESCRFDQYGAGGDSGVLVSSAEDDPDDRDVLAIYLGKAPCRDASGLSWTEGYGTGLEHAAALFRASPLKGVFND